MARFVGDGSGLGGYESSVDEGSETDEQYGMNEDTRDPKLVADEHALLRIEDLAILDYRINRIWARSSVSTMSSMIPPSQL